MASESYLGSEELSQLARDLYQTAERTFPNEVKKFMRGQGNKGTRAMRKNIRSLTKKKTGNLLKGVGKSKVYTYKESFQIRVKDTAPHAHLIERGHEVWLPEKQAGGGFKGVDQGRRSTGKHFAAKTNADLLSTFEGDVDKFVEKMLEKGLGV